MYQPIPVEYYKINTSIWKDQQKICRQKMSIVFIYIYIYVCVCVCVCVCVYQHICTSRIWHKVKFYAEINRFEFRAFLSRRFA